MRRQRIACAAAYAALFRSGVHDLRVVTRSYSLSQLSLLKKHETMVSSHGKFQSADRLIKRISLRHGSATVHGRTWTS